MRINRLRGMGFALVGLVTGGCSTTAQMVVPADIKSLDVIRVEDRSTWSGSLADESFKMGPYRVAEVDRDWSSSSGVSVFGFSSDKTEGGYAFDFKHGDGVLKGQCTTEAKKTGMNLLGGVSFEDRVAKLGCRCLRGEDQVAKTVLSAGSGSEYAGTLETSTGKYGIVALYERKGTMSTGEPSGYRVDGDAPVGAAEVLKPGRVWLAKSAAEAERAELACLFAGLMLYMPPSDH